MLSPESVLAALARELVTDIPPADSDGERIFDLDGDLRLGVFSLPDGSAHIAWSAVSDSLPGEPPAEAEERAAAFLRTHLGRLRRCGQVAATRDSAGANILYIRSAPSTEAEWLQAVTALLNETEAVRNILADRTGGRVSGGRAGGAGTLFSGMAGFLRGR